MRRSALFDGVVGGACLGVGQKERFLLLRASPTARGGRTCVHWRAAAAWRATGSHPATQPPFSTKTAFRKMHISIARLRKR